MADVDKSITVTKSPPGVNPDNLVIKENKTGKNIKVTWVPSGGSLDSNSFSWKPGFEPSPLWTPTLDGHGNLVGEYTAPSSSAVLTWKYNVTISGVLIDPEITNEEPPPPPTGEEKPPRGPHGQPGGPGGPPPNP